MRKSKVFSLVFGLCVSVSSFAQSTNKIGVGLTTDSDQRIFLNYNASTKQHFSLNFRLSQGWDIDKTFAGGDFVTDNSTNEISYEEFQTTNAVLQSKLIIGPEFQIKESNFSWGIEGILGYRSQLNSTIKDVHDVSSSNVAPNNMLILYPAESSRPYWTSHQQFLTTGVQGRFSVQAMATERLGLELFGEIGLEYNIRLSQVVNSAEEPIAQPLEEGVVLKLPKNVFVPGLRLGATLFLKH